jgi:hypothetical protein
MNKHFAKVVLLVPICVTGCATTAVNNARTALHNRNLAYGAVFDVKSFASDANREKCAQNTDPTWKPVCNDIDAYEQANVAFLNSSRLISGYVVVPKLWAVQPGAIVQVNPRRSAVATQLAAAAPRPGCAWTGHSLEDLTGRAGMLKGFALGMLVVPAIAIAADPSLHEGGVECDGWSYKTLLKSDAIN